MHLRSAGCARRTSWRCISFGGEFDVVGLPQIARSSAGRCGLALSKHQPEDWVRVNSGTG